VRLIGNNFEQSAALSEPQGCHRVSYSGTRPAMMRVPIRFPAISRRQIEMVITAAHVPAIVALIAGILILIMPRLLNMIVAIYLICVGLIGLGLLRWLHL
jgi:hypothetical protein